MSTDTKTLELGAAKISILNIGDLTITLSEMMNVPESEWRPRYEDILGKPGVFPSYCIHIALPGASVLVDANNYALSAPPGYPYAMPQGYQPPPDLLTQLRQRGIQPEDITHVVITHAHFDHYAGVTREQDGAFVPSFPNARYYLGKADWEYPETQEALRDPDSADSRTFGVLHKAGLLELVEGERELTPQVKIFPAPGESPGHQIVRITSEGQTLYCLGDLFHHPIEVEHPSWMSQWDDPTTNVASRLALTETALTENALLIAAHIPAVGRLERTETGARWVNVS
jgi:glyoxylase-like metal-dependent hydrolase (beta-lactamase superfamily II)